MRRRGVLVSVVLLVLAVALVMAGGDRLVEWLVRLHGGHAAH